MKKRETSFEQSIINMEKCIKNYKTASEVVTLNLEYHIVEQDRKDCIHLLNGKINEKCQSWKKGSKCHKCTNYSNKMMVYKTAQELKKALYVSNVIL